MEVVIVDSFSSEPLANKKQFWKKYMITNFHIFLILFTPLHKSFNSLKKLH